MKISMGISPLKACTPIFLVSLNKRLDYMGFSKNNYTLIVSLFFGSEVPNHLPQSMYMIPR